MKREVRDYYIAIGTWTAVCEEVSRYLNHGYQLAGSMAVLDHHDERGDYVLFYQPLIGLKAVELDGEGK